MEGAMSNLGMGVMLNYLKGNRESVEVFKSSIGKGITRLELLEENDGALLFTFADETKMQMRDDGRSCCEDRYMHTDDDLQSFIGSKLLTAEIRDAPDVEDEYDAHEVQFLVVATSKGVFTVETHNEHNGYYSGFALVAEIAN
jgi:hypothetical protein